MKIFEYDVWDGDKGIIIANDEDEAVRIFKKEYDLPVVGVDVEDQEHGTCVIDEVADLHDHPALYFLHD